MMPSIGFHEEKTGKTNNQNYILHQACDREIMYQAIKSTYMYFCEIL